MSQPKLNTPPAPATAASKEKLRKPRARNAPPAIDTHTRAPKPAKNSDVVYRDLRRAIISMDLTPGTPIAEKEITERYGISRTPVREAVLKLAEERLVDVVPKSGTFVSRIPLSILREALVARRALEEVTVRAATSRASQSQIMHLRAIIQRQQEIADRDDKKAFHEADDAFHMGIAAAAGFPGIWEMIQQIRIQVERYRRLTLPQKGRMHLIINEHTAVLDAIANHDSDEAVRCMYEHLDKLQLDISVFRDLSPEYFILDLNLDTDMVMD